MAVELDELQKEFIKQGHKKFAEPNTVCRCGGWLKSVTYQCESMAYTNLVNAEGEKAHRELMVCEDCGAVYAMPVVIEKDA